MSNVKSHHRFAVDPVSAATKPLPTEKAKVSVERLLGTPVEACDSYSANVVRQPGFHSLIAAAHLAYQHHYPLVLTPDAVWLTLAQGLANHVNLHAERLRPLFVRHQGKPTVGLFGGGPLSRRRQSSGESTTLLPARGTGGAGTKSEVCR
jgi:hypothetical protein